MLFLGIDPGASGGWAWVTDANVGEAEPMPKTERDVWRDIARPFDFAVIEHVHSMPGQGVSSTFKFGMSYGALRMALIAAEIPFESVAPGVWQREFGLIGKKGETKVQKKNRHKQKAQELWPSMKVTHAVADAMLLAEFARRIHARRQTP